MELCLGLSLSVHLLFQICSRVNVHYSYWSRSLRLMMNLVRRGKRLGGKLFNLDNEARLLERMVQSVQPLNARIGVCFYAPPPGKFRGGGKVSADEFLPVFCRFLREQGVRTYFASSNRLLADAVRQPERTVVVCIYREVGYVPKGESLMSILENADLVFNHPKSGLIIANKPLANAALSAAGCSVPLSAEALDHGSTIFSNEISASGAATQTIQKSDSLDETRHNTQYIDTRQTFEGQEYHTTMRLMCINDKITHLIMRARNVTEGDASVHAKDTPKNAELINFLWRKALEDAGDQFQKIANTVYSTFGPGFYSHDTLLDKETHQVYICETGYKFDDNAYQRRVNEIAFRISGLKLFETGENTAISSAPIFLKQIHSLLDEN